MKDRWIECQSSPLTLLSPALSTTLAEWYLVSFSFALSSTAPSSLSIRSPNSATTVSFRLGPASNTPSGTMLLIPPSLFSPRPRSLPAPSSRRGSPVFARGVWASHFSQAD
eukprot:2230800-Rhodomonas_salina.3